MHKDCLLAMFSEKRSRAKKAYVEFMRKQEPDEFEVFYSKKNLPSILGDDAFKDWLKEKFQHLRFKPEIPASKELALSSKTIRELVCKTFKVNNDALMFSRRGTENLPRDGAIFLQRKFCDQTLTELGKDFDMPNYSSVSSACERIKSRLSKDGKLKRKVARIENRLKKSQIFQKGK